MTDEHSLPDAQLAMSQHETSTAGRQGSSYSPVGIAQTLAAGEPLRCDMADPDASSARVAVECFSRVDAEVIAAGALISGGARLETADCATCLKLNPSVVAVFKDSQNFVRETDERSTITIENVGFASGDGAEGSRKPRTSRSRWKFANRTPAERPEPALSRRNLFLMGFTKRDGEDRDKRETGLADRLSDIRLGASPREVYLASHPDPVLPSVAVTGTCTACAVCVQICPAGALALEGEDLTLNPERCIECSKCVTMCPEKVLAIQPRHRGRDARVIANIPHRQCTTCGRPLGPQEHGVCHNCTTLGTLTSGIWDMYEEK